MAKLVRIALLILSVQTAAPGVVRAQSPELKQVVEQRVQAFVQATSSSDPAQWQRFWTENFSMSMQNLPASMHYSFFGRTWDTSHGLQLHGIQQNAGDVTVLFKNKLTHGWNVYSMAFTPEPPHRIAGMRWLPAAPPVPTPKLTDAQLVSEISSLVKRLGDADAFSGTVLLAKGREVVFRAAHGNADKDFDIANRLDTKFNLGSMNKMFTAVAVMQLVERGKLSLEDRLSKYVPGFPDEAAAEKIKIRHLLSHTAGLGGYFSPRFRESARDLYRDVDSMMKLAAADEKLLFEPGARFQYSNTGMLVLGKVIEVVSGRSYYDYVRENIYQPAGMSNTDSYELDRVNRNMAKGYEKLFTERGVEFRNNLYAHVIRGGPQGGGYSTVDDLFRFAQALQSNQLVKPETRALLLTSKSELNSMGYGYGFVVDGRGIAGHSGGFPGIESNLDMFTQHGWTAIVLSNYSNGGGMTIVERIRELVTAQ